MNPFLTPANITKEGSQLIIKLVDSQRCSIPLMRTKAHITMNSFEELVKTTPFQKDKDTRESSKESVTSKSSVQFPKRSHSVKVSNGKQRTYFHSPHSWPKSHFYQESQRV